MYLVGPKITMQNHEMWTLPGKAENFASWNVNVNLDLNFRHQRGHISCCGATVAIPVHQVEQEEGCQEAAGLVRAGGIGRG